jgi:hypothetical protein
MSFMPLGRREKCNRWLSGSNNKMRVNDANQLVALGARDDEMRDGDWLAAEARGQQRVAMPRVRRRDLEVVAEDDDVAAQFAQAEAADDRRRAWAERILGGRGAGEARGEDVIFAHPEAVPINEEAVFIPME